MAVYSNLSYGASGSEVRKMQQALKEKGYDLGSSGADGLFGAQTQAALRQYQQDKGLRADGVAGSGTLDSLYSSPEGEAPARTGSDPARTGSAPAQTGSAPAAAPAQSGSGYSYDPSGDRAYQQALAALQSARENAPSYAGTYDGQLQELYEQIVNRDSFRYDLNADALYRQYKDQYINQGQMAMMDAMGQAAALTGGYGSSYGQSVGQQTYQQYLKGLNDQIPELYSLALDRYNREGQQLQNQYAMLGDLRDEEYGRYQDALSEYWRNLDYLQGQADDEYNRGYENWYNAYRMESSAKNTAYNRLIDLMSSSGYMPTEQELAAAGMTREQAESFGRAWKAENPDLAYRTGAITPDEYWQMTGEYPEGYAPPAAGGAGSGWNNGGLSRSQVKALQQAMGMSGADGFSGPNTQAAFKALGYSSLREAYNALVGGKGGSYAFGELLNAAASGMSKKQMEEMLAARGVKVSRAAVQADIKKALSK